MKKLLSVLVIVAMLLTSLVPAMVSVAAGGLALEVSSPTFYLTSTDDPLTVNATVSITNNPGLAQLRFFVYYTKAEIELTAATLSTTGAVFDTMPSLILNKVSKTAPYSTALTAAGVTPSTAIYCADITLESASSVLTTGAAVDLTFAVKGDLASMSENDSFAFGVIPYEVYDADWNDVTADVATKHVPGTVTATVDPYAPVYADKSSDAFTFFVDDVTVYAGHADTVRVGVGVTGNNRTNAPDGFATIQMFLPYDKALTCLGVVNGDLYADAEFELGMTDIDLSKESSMFPMMVDAFNSVGYVAPNDQHLAIQVFYAPEPDDAVNNQIKDNGYLTYITFKLPEAAKAGDVYKIKFIANPEEVMSWNNTSANIDDWYKLLPFNYSDGSIKVVEYGVCSHEDTREDKLEPTCTVEGYTKVICNICGEEISNTPIPALGHIPGEKVTTKEPTLTEAGTWEIRCTRCNEVLETGSIDMLTPVVNTEITVGTANAKTDATVEIPVTLDTNSGFFIASLDLAFDISALTFVSAKIGNVVTDPAYIYITNYADGKVKIYMESSTLEDIKATGTVATLTFKVADDAALAGTASAITLTAEAGNFINSKKENIDCTFNAGAVNVLAREAITAEGTTVDYNGNVSVPVKVSANVGIWGARFEFTYDATLLEFVSIDSGLFTTTAGENYSVKDGVITVFVENADAFANVTDDGTLFTLNFKALDDGTSTVKTTLVEAINADKAVLDGFKLFDATVIVNACTHPTTTAVVTTEPTTTSEGVLSHICDVCGEVVRTEPIAKLAFVEVETTATVKANAEITVPVKLTNNPGIWSIGLEITFDSTKFDFVSIDGANSIFPVSADNYSVNNGVITVFLDAATATENVTADGLLFNLTLKAKAAAELGNSDIAFAVVADKTINVAKDQVKIQNNTMAVEILAHDHIAGTVTNPCLEDVVCTVCGEILTPALGHEPGAPATCHSPQVCTRCGEEIAPALEHVPGPEATCTEAQTCTLCGDVLVDALGHEEGAWVVTKPATEGEDGTKELRCVRYDQCGHVFRTETIVYVPFIVNLIKGYSAKSIALDGTTITLTAINNMTDVDFAPVIAKGSTITTTGNVQVFKNGSLTYYKSTLETDKTYTFTVTLATGETETYTVNVIFPTSAEITTHNGWSVRNLSVDNDTKEIFITSTNNVPYVDFALNIENIPQASTRMYNADGDEVAYVYSGHRYFAAYAADGDNQTMTLVITLNDGSTVTYTVHYQFSYSYISSVERGYYAQSVTIEDNTITMVTKANAPMSDFRVYVPYGATVAVTSGTGEVVAKGGFYLYSYRANGLTQSYEITVTLAGGKTSVYTVNVEFK